MTTAEIKKTYIRAPVPVPLSTLQKVVHALVGILLSPIYWLSAAFYPTPGLRFRAKCFTLGLRLWLAARAPFSVKNSFLLMFMPMDSTRYFEFDYASRTLSGLPMERYLDVSSPRLVPVTLLEERQGLTADLINPIAKDLADTGKLIDAAGLATRCRLHSCLIEDAPFPPESFDVVTSISVVEHIPEDTKAIQKIWSLLKPGGVFVLTVPCMAEASEQYIDFDEYRLFQTDRNGFVFWQRFYDQRLLNERIFCTTGQPKQYVVYGEKVAGSFLKNAEQKRGNSRYPYWREPYMMAREYRYFDTVDQLPGEGVIGMIFTKQR